MITQKIRKKENQTRNRSKTASVSNSYINYTDVLSSAVFNLSIENLSIENIYARLKIVCNSNNGLRWHKPKLLGHLTNVTVKVNES